MGVFAEDLDGARGARRETEKARSCRCCTSSRWRNRGQDKPWRDPKNWPLVTPNAGRSIEIDRLVAEAADEEAKGEAAFRIWASQHLNIQVGVALAYGSWVGAEVWEQNGSTAVTLDALLERSEVIDFGIDGGGLKDLLGAAAVGRDRETQEWLHWAKSLGAPSVTKYQPEIAQKLEDLAKAGEATLVQEIGDDVKEVAEIAARIHKGESARPGRRRPARAQGNPRRARNRRRPEGKIVGVSQGWKLNSAILTTERKLAAGQLLHGGTALMAWCVGCAKVEPKGNAVTITKQASGSGKSTRSWRPSTRFR